MHKLLRALPKKKYLWIEYQGEFEEFSDFHEGLHHIAQFQIRPLKVDILRHDIFALSLQEGTETLQCYWGDLEGNLYKTLPPTQQIQLLQTLFSPILLSLSSQTQHLREITFEDIIPVAYAPFVLSQPQEAYDTRTPKAWLKRMGQIMGGLLGMGLLGTKFQLGQSWYLQSQAVKRPPLKITMHENMWELQRHKQRVARHPSSEHLLQLGAGILLAESLGYRVKLPQCVAS